MLVSQAYVIAIFIVSTSVYISACMVFITWLKWSIRAKCDELDLPSNNRGMPQVVIDVPKLFLCALQGSSFVLHR